MARSLGECLLARKRLTRRALQEALAAQAQGGGRLGEVLISRGDANYLAVYQALAERHGLIFANLLTERPEPALLHAEYLMDYLELKLLPWRKREGVVMVATSEPQSAEVRAWCKKKYGNAWCLTVTSPFDLRHAIERRFSGKLTAISRELLYRLSPERSAKVTFTRSQQNSLLVLTFCLLAASLFTPLVTMAALVLAFHLLYTVTMAYKTLLYMVGRQARRKTVPPPTPIRDAALPVYSILVPLYREKESVPHLIRHLQRLDYPHAKLDIKLIVEEDDRETIRAILACRPPHHMELIRVPYSEPRTKPKACNYGMRFARGEYVTIYDAEDRPEPQQLRKAVAAFRASAPDVVCLQARLRYYNANENLLTRWFDLEYAILFGALLPGLACLGIPLPLGGTSNHFALNRLRALGEWDPYNVTEDADLGVRISVAGYRTQMLDSTTLEEAPVSLRQWMNQRSRWIKGYMQTWLVHMRRPRRLLATIGMAAFMGMQFFLGLSCLIFLSVPVIWLLSLPFLAHATLPADSPMPGWFTELAYLNLVFYFFMQWLHALAITEGKAFLRTGLMLAVATFPLYWYLHCFASYKALWQLFMRPHYWEKTRHGLSAYLQKAQFSLLIPAPALQIAGRPRKKHIFVD